MIELVVAGEPKFVNEENRFVGIGRLQHMSIFLLFILHGIVDFLKYKKLLVLEGLEYFTLAVTFAWWVSLLEVVLNGIFQVFYLILTIRYHWSIKGTSRWRLRDGWYSIDISRLSSLQIQMYKLETFKGIAHKLKVMLLRYASSIYWWKTS